MKILSRIVALVMVTLLLGACSKAVNTPEKIAKTIAEAIIKSDQLAFEKFIINQDAAIQMFQQLIVSAKKDKKFTRHLPKLERELTSLKSSSNVTLARVRTKVKKSFNDISKKAKKAGIDLSKATFGKVVDIRTEKYLDRIKYDIYFTLNSGKLNYTIKLDNVVTIADQLYLLDRVEWKGKKSSK